MKEKIEDFRQLEVWKKSHKITLRIYKITKNYPEDERYGLISQMRRAAVSVTANIVEGFKRRGKGEKKQFFNISQASANELLYFLILSKDLGYLKDVEDDSSDLESVSMMLSAMIRKLSKQQSQELWD
jgi:four helix bundle protein